MGKLKDITGMIFGRLVVSARGEDYIRPSGRREPQWTCLCQCGATVLVVSWNLVSGHTKSCGCLQKSATSKANTRHGHTASNHISRTYQSYMAMITRCQNSSTTYYANYGGRGIVVCDRWDPQKGGSFENFLSDLGERPEGTTLDRINVDGNYEPNNCRWSDRTIQSYNQKKMKNNTSGKTGVYFCKTSNKWVSEISVKRKRIRLGCFDFFEDAVAAREAAELHYYGFHKNE